MYYLKSKRKSKYFWNIQILLTNNPIKIIRLSSLLCKCFIVFYLTFFLSNTLNAQTVIQNWAVLEANARPWAIAADASGNIYTANYSNSTVSKITPAGTVIQNWSILTTGASPLGIATDAFGNVYTANSGNSTVSKITPAGVIAQTWAVGIGPRGITVDAAGNIYTANNYNSITGTYNNTVSKITSTGIVTQTWAVLAIAAGPLGITNDGIGNIYTSNTNNNTVSKINTAGTVTEVWALGTSPYNITIDASGNIYTSNYYNSTVSKITPTGTVTQNWATLSSGTRPVGIAIDVSGNVYTANNGSYTVTKITPTGIVTQAWALLHYTAGPAGIVIDASGDLYTSNYSNNTVSKIIPPHPPATHLNFDGADDFVATTVASPSPATSDFTCEAYIYPTDISTVKSIVRNTGKFNISINAGNLYAQVWPSGSGSNGITYTGPTINANQWTHVAVIWNRTSQVFSMYVNGSSVSYITGAIGPVVSENFTIGNSTILNEPFTGNIDEVRLFNVELSAADILRTKDCELKGTEAGLIAYYNFNQGDHAGNNLAVTTLTNAVSGGSNGSLSNFALIGAMSNWMTGSPVVTGSVILGAPIVLAQTFCENTTVASLVPTPGTSIKWYNVATGGTALSSLTAISTSGTYYVDSVNSVGCESIRTAVSVTISDITIAVTNNSSTIAVTGTTYFPSCTNVIAKLSPIGVAPVSGNTTAKVWIEAVQPSQFVKRHYEITPNANANTATARVTLYFTQAEFDDFNAVNTTKLPAGPADGIGINNLRIDKFAGVSNNGTGLIGTYTGTYLTIDPVNSNIVWNASANRWEISFDVTGFSGFFVKTFANVLPVTLMSFSGSKQNNNDVMLQWQSVNEVNLAKYIVENSNDGSNFSEFTIAAVKSGTGFKSYAVIDNSPWINDSKYYRLKMVDNDGRFTFSTIVKMSNTQRQTASVYPNPVSTLFTLDIGNNRLLNTPAKITDVTGRTIMVFNIISNHQNVNVSSFAKGMYKLQLADGSLIKIIKQ
jgi:streptogramin lyase